MSSNKTRRKFSHTMTLGISPASSTGDTSTITFIAPSRDSRDSYVDCVKTLLEYRTNDKDDQKLADINSFTVKVQLYNYTRKRMIASKTIEGSEILAAMRSGDTCIIKSVQFEGLRRHLEKHDHIWQISVSSSSTKINVTVNGMQFVLFRDETRADNATKLNPVNIIASSVLAPWIGSYANSDDNSRFWMTQKNATQQWLMYDFGSLVIPKKVALKAGLGHAGKNVAIQGSVDGRRWDTIHIVDSHKWNCNDTEQSYHVDIDIHQAIRYVRLTVNPVDYVLYRTVKYYSS